MFLGLNLSLFIAGIFRAPFCRSPQLAIELLIQAHGNLVPLELASSVVVLVILPFTLFRFFRVVVRGICTFFSFLVLFSLNVTWYAVPQVVWAAYLRTVCAVHVLSYTVFLLLRLFVFRLLWVHGLEMVRDMNEATLSDHHQ